MADVKKTAEQFSVKILGDFHRCCAKCCDTENVGLIERSKCIFKCGEIAEETRNLMKEINKNPFHNCVADCFADNKVTSNLSEEALLSDCERKCQQKHSEIYENAIKQMNLFTKRLKD